MDLLKYFKDKNGKIVIAQWPNLPLWIALVCFLLGFSSQPVIKNLSSWGLLISLLYWSYLEIFYGVNLFRKTLGIAVLISQIFQLLKLFF